MKNLKNEINKKINDLDNLTQLQIHTYDIGILGLFNKKRHS